MTSFKDEYRKLLAGKWTDIRFHLPYLYKVACSYENPSILELGTRDGNSTIAFMAAIEKSGGKLTSVDVDHADIDGEMQMRMFDLDWTFVKQDDMQYDPPPGSIYDIVFIDTSHHLYHTLQELRRYLHFMKPGSRFLMHDTEWHGLDVPDGDCMHGEFYGMGPVAWALDVFCREGMTAYPDGSVHRMSWVNHPGSFGLGELLL